MLKHSDSLGSWIERVAGETFEQPLEYPNFEFEIKEFDNVPLVLPRFLFHLNHQLKSVCEYLKKRDEEERTESVRKYFTQKHKEADNNFNEFKKTEIEGKLDSE